jgi:hypothetical protein
VRVLLPPPQSAEHLDHGVQPPFTACIKTNTEDRVANQRNETRREWETAARTLERRGAIGC